MTDIAPPSRSRRGGSRRKAYLACGAILAVGALVSAAAFTDRARLNLGGEGGFASPADLHLEVKEGNVSDLAEDGTWQRFTTQDGAGAVPIAGADALHPGGDSVTAHIPVRNASPGLAAEVGLTLVSRTDVDDPSPSAWAVDAEGEAVSVGASNRAYLEALRFDAALDGTPIASGRTYDELAVALGSFAPGQARLLTVDVSLAADGHEDRFNGGTAAVLVHLTATS